ncbi:hypothetical protein [Mesorhizobium sp. M0663]|uniref:hypothetical protein n=1 Tax=unclassified Mesorhizobium TaxID=325217 RepID=UPI00333AE310
MAVEIAEEMVEARREPAREFRRVQPTFSIIADTIGEHAAKLAEHIVPLQPHIGHAVDVGMRLPDLARIFFGQPAQIVRQALTFEQQKSGGIGHVGSLN